MSIIVYHENPSDLASFTRLGDAWAIDEQNMIFAVADSPLRHLLRDTRNYPFDDFGYETASTFCDEFLLSFRNILQKGSFTEKSLRIALLEANVAIDQLNKKRGRTYGDKSNYDIAETVGIGAVVSEGVLYYGGLEDCYVNILRGPNLENVAVFEYQIMKASKYLDVLTEQGKVEEYIPEDIRGKLRKESLWEPCWCTHLRNNLEARDEKGNLVGWGCFTGEAVVGDFIQTHAVELEKGDRILLFSDGMIPVLENDVFVEWFIKNRHPSFHFELAMRKRIMQLLAGKDSAHKEKTLIYFEYE